MPKFALDFERCLLEQNSAGTSQQAIRQKIHDMAVCLKLLKEDEPLPPDLDLKTFQDSKTISVIVEFPKN